MKDRHRHIPTNPPPPTYKPTTPPTTESCAVDAGIDAATVADCSLAGGVAVRGSRACKRFYGTSYAPFDGAATTCGCCVVDEPVTLQAEAAVVCLDAGAASSSSGTCDLDLVEGPGSPFVGDPAVLAEASVVAPLLGGAVDAAFAADPPEGASAAGSCGGACGGGGASYGAFRYASEDAVATALVPLVGAVGADDAVFVLVWGPLRSAADAADKRGTPPDLDLRVTFLADEATGERCLVSAGQPACGDAALDATYGSVDVAAARADGSPVVERYGVEHVVVSPLRDTAYTLWVHNPPRDDEDAEQPVQLADAAVYVFGAAGLVGGEALAAAPPACGATNASAGLKCENYDYPVFADPAPLRFSTGAARTVWSAPADNRRRAEYTAAVCVDAAFDGDHFDPIAYEVQRHYTAQGWAHAQRVAACDAPRECDGADAAVWHCSSLLENGLFRCPGAMHGMLYCDAGTRCDADAAADAAVDDPRATMCVADGAEAPSAAPTYGPTLNLFSIVIPLD